MGLSQTKPKLERKKYILLNEFYKDTSSIFKGRKPNIAAKKAATRGYKMIRLRQVGTQKVHVYSGRIEIGKKDIKKDPEWLSTNYRIPRIKKLQIIYLDEYRRNYTKKTRSGKIY